MAEEKATPEKEKNIKVNRREFLKIAFLASLGLVSLEAAGLTVLFAMPTFREGVRQWSMSARSPSFPLRPTRHATSQK
jgi:hypothetical protein